MIVSAVVGVSTRDQDFPPVAMTHSRFMRK